MNTKRALIGGLLLYITSFVVYMILFAAGLVSMEEYTLNAFIIGWVVNIPIVLLIAKWYFKKDSPTTKKGLHLGLYFILVALVLDGLSVLGAWASGQPLDQFMELYSSWPFYVTIAEVILLATYAGFEFDGTYTPPQA